MQLLKGASIIRHDPTPQQTFNMRPATEGHIDAARPSAQLVTPPTSAFLHSTLVPRCMDRTRLLCVLAYHRRRVVHGIPTTSFLPRSKHALTRSAVLAFLTVF